MRLNLALTLAVMATALYLVHVQYESRRLYVELEKAAAQTYKLEAAHESLQAQTRGQATPLRVERLAKTQPRARFRLFGFSLTPSCKSCSKP